MHKNTFLFYNKILITHNYFLCNVRHTCYISNAPSFYNKKIWSTKNPPKTNDIGIANDFGLGGSRPPPPEKYATVWFNILPYYSGEVEKHFWITLYNIFLKNNFFNMTFCYKKLFKNHTLLYLVKLIFSNSICFKIEKNS